MQKRLVVVYILVLSFLLIIAVKIIKQENIFTKLENIKISPYEEDKIVQGEYLILPKENSKAEMEGFFNELDLKIIAPIDNWLYIGKNRQTEDNIIINLNSKKAHDDIYFLNKIKEYPQILDASLNFIEPDDLSCFKPQIAAPRSKINALQWYFRKDTGINLEDAWSLTMGNKKQVIAIVDRNYGAVIEDCGDQKYYYENICQYFPNKKILEKDYILHGFDVLNILAPCFTNEQNLTGVDLRSQVFLVDSKEDKSLSARLFGLLWAGGIDVCQEGFFPCPKEMDFQKNLHEAQVINASFGFSGKFLEAPPYGPVLDVVGRLNREGKIIVASAGNEGQLADRRLPGAAGGVISVGSSNREKKSSVFNNYGKSMDVLAPGEGLIGFRDEKTVLLNGTSFAAPIVSGLCSLLLSVNKEFSWKHIEYVLKSTSNPLSCSDYCQSNMKNFADCKSHCCKEDKVICASGIVDAFKALQFAKDNKSFNVPLIDLDDYFINLHEKSEYKANLLVKNWGFKDGLVVIKSNNKSVKFFPNNFILKKASDFSKPNTAQITVYFAGLPKREIVSNITLEIEDLEGNKDSIGGILDIKPLQATKPKKFKELF